ncbi:MAG TPA: beta-ketoacyl-ACP synthase III [Gemmatimonadaceae bacterium]|jgi:3-oxoacyl-[acyl-carrier-protein] synthase III|nr:beta-ketoacyl-ACP synthase III [Gemmatimonadaceae bacterium]
MKRPVAYFAGTGRGVPATVMTNFDFAKIGIETTDEWIVERTGIKQRHIAKTESTTDLAAMAARKAMEKAGVHPGELDIIVLGTASPDRLLPSAAVDLQAALGASRAAAFDVGAACSGFIYSSTVAEAMLAAGNAETALVVGVEKLSAITDWSDRSTCVLFGDGAGAAVIQRSKHHRGILSAFLRSDGSLGDLLCRPGGGAARPFSNDVLSERSQFIKMNGREVFKNAVRSMSEAATRALDAAKLTGADIDLMIPHQANIRIIEATAKHASIPTSKVYVNVDRFGNTSAASIPIALDEAIELGVVGEGSLVLLVAFGAGFTWGSMVLRL